MTFSTLDDAVVLAALATLMAMIMIGLGFLYRPNMASLLWSLMFVLVTLSAYGTVIANAASLHLLGDAAAGLAFGAPAMVWSGLRAARGARPYAWFGPIQAVLSAAAYPATDGMGIHSFVFSLLYLIYGIMAGLSVLELLRRPERGGGRLLPLTLASAVLPVIGIASIIAVAITWSVTPGSPVLPDLKAISQLAYLTCAIVTLLSVARYPVPPGSDEALTSFPSVVADRLERARAADEQNWSLLAVSLDDTDTLRVAGGEVAFRHIEERFRADVRGSFPADADIAADGPHAYLVLLSRPDGSVRDHIRTLLDRVATMTDDQPLAVEFSASVGWAKAVECDYDADALMDAARRARARAEASGGHRLERAQARL